MSQMPETPWSHDDQMMVTSPRQNFFSRQLSQFSTIEDLSELNPFDAEFKAALSKRSHDTIDSALEPMTPGPLSPIDVLGEFIPSNRSCLWLRLAVASYRTVLGK